MMRFYQKYQLQPVTTSIDEGQDAVFELTATGTLINALEVDVRVDDGVG